MEVKWFPQMSLGTFYYTKLKKLRIRDPVLLWFPKYPENEDLEKTFKVWDCVHA